MWIKTRIRLWSYGVRTLFQSCGLDQLCQSAFWTLGVDSTELNSAGIFKGLLNFFSQLLKDYR